MTATARMNGDNVNPFVKATKYAVRGELSIRADELGARLEKRGHQLPFQEIVSAHIGNPQGLGQKPITFFRQVLSLLENPELLRHEDVLLDQLSYQPDVLERAKRLLAESKSVGSYTPSCGLPTIRKSVARFIEGMFSYRKCDVC